VRRWQKVGWSLVGCWMLVWGVLLGCFALAYFGLAF